MAMDKMEKLVRESLNEGETVLWHSETKPFGLLEGRDGKKVLKKMITAVVVFGGLTAAYMTMMEDVKTGFAAILLVVMAAMLIAPVVEWASVKKQAYWLTNQRAILVKGVLTASFLQLARVDDYTVVPMENGNSCLVLGSKVVQEGTKQLRWRSAHPLEDSQSAGKTIDGLVFYNVENVQAAVSVLESSTAVA